MQIDDLSRKEFNSKKDAQKSEDLKEELAKSEEQVEKMKRELSRAKQEVEDLRETEEQLAIVRDEKEKLRMEVARLQSKAEEVTELKQAFDAREEEMRALKRMSSEEMDLEGKLSRLKDRCREKDDEIEELHQKVIALQVKIKDFMQQNSMVEEEMRNVKDKHCVELEEKERLAQTLKNNENKQRKLDKDLQESKKRNEDLEKELSQIKRALGDIETERDTERGEKEKLTERNENLAAELSKLEEKISELEEATRLAKENEDLPEETSTPMDNISMENSLRLDRGGRASIAMERLEELEEENVQLLLKQRELEEELDAAEQHADELKNTLKAKRENVNELYLELDTVKEKLKSSEKARAELGDDKEQLQETCVSLRKKVEDTKAANERYMDEADEIEKALTAAEKKVQDLEKKLEEVSGKCANSEGQLQSVTERLTRKEKELSVVETHVEEQRKLCDGYKTAVEKQESLLKKFRIEKTSVDDELIALKLEIAKKEGTYKSSKEKINEIQNRLYETEDKCTSKTNECKKLNRENERLKREVSDLERKVSDLQALKKTTMSVDVVKKSPNNSEYNTKLLHLNTALKTDHQNVEGLDTKLNSAQNKISTLEVALAKDLRKFSLQRTSSDTPRRGYSPGDSPGGRRPRSSSSMTSDTFEGTRSPVDKDGASGDSQEHRNENGAREEKVPDEGLLLFPNQIIITPDEKEKTGGVQGTSNEDVEDIKEMWTMLDEFPGLNESRVDSQSSDVTMNVEETERDEGSVHETWSSYRDETIVSAYDVGPSSNHNGGRTDNHHKGGDDVYSGLVDFFNDDNEQVLSRTAVSNTESALSELDPFLRKTATEKSLSNDGDIDGTDHTGGSSGGNHGDESSGQVFPVTEKVTCTSYPMCGDQNEALPENTEEMIYF